MSEPGFGVVPAALTVGGEPLVEVHVGGQLHDAREVDVRDSLPHDVVDQVRLLLFADARLLPLRLPDKTKPAHVNKCVYRTRT